MALGGKTQIGRNLTVGVGRVGEKVFRQIDLLSEDEIRDSEPFVLTENFGEIIGV